MGATVSKAQETVMNNISNEISNQVKTASSTDCQVTQGNIVLNGPCKYTVKNQCSSDATGTISAISQAAVSSFQQLSQQQQQALLPSLQLGVTDSSDVNQTVI